MAKNVKKPKTAAKASSKPAPKPVKKQAKPAAPAKKSATQQKPAKAAKPAAKTTAPVNGKKPAVAAPAKTKAPKADSKAKKGKRGEEFEEDDLMVSDEDLGAEEIPDLSEFEEEEEVIIAESTDDDEDEEEEPEKAPSDMEAVLTDAEGRPYCKVKDCDQIAAVDTYCRYHYLLLWKRIQVRRKILIDGKLERYVEELTARYPDKFLEMIRRDLRTEKDFLSAIAELEIDESGLDGDFEDDSQVLDEVRGFGAESSSSMSDDDGEF